MAWQTDERWQKKINWSMLKITKQARYGQYRNEVWKKNNWSIRENQMQYYTKNKWSMT